MTPLAAAGGAFCLGLALAELALPDRPALGIGALALAAVAAALAPLVRPLTIGFALAAALAGVARAELPAADPAMAARAHLLAGRTVVATAVAVDDPRAVAGGYELLVHPLAVRDSSGTFLPPAGDLLVHARGPEAAEYGDRLDLKGRLRLPDERPDFDRRAYLAQRQVWLELAATSVSATQSEWTPAQVPSQVRSAYRGVVEALVPEPHSAVLLGVVLGIRAGIPTRMQAALQATGLVHLLVLSGLKVAVFTRLAAAALEPVLGRWAAAPLLALVGLYALAGGATPAAVRAAAMGGLTILAARLGRPAHVWTSLAATGAAMLGWHPELAFDVGFQLSFFGTAAIVLLTPSIAARLRWLPPLFREPFAVTVAAQVGTLPLTAAGFHVLSPIAPLANALVLPLLPLMVGGGLLLAPLSVAPEAGRAAAIPLVALLAYLEQVATLLAAIPAAAIPIGSFPSWLTAAYYAALGGGVAALRSAGGRRLAAIALAVLLPVVIAAAEVVAWHSSPPSAVLLDVGEGQAVLLSGPGGRVLIDGGPSPARLSAALGEQLPPWEDRLAALVITSPGLAHAGGLAGFSRPVGTVVLPASDPSGTTWRSVAAAEAGRGATLLRASAGMRLVLAGLRFEVLAPEPGAPSGLPGAADLALRVIAPDGRAFCDLGDLDPPAQAAAAARLTGPCDYLLLPDRGGSTPAPDLLSVARPQAILFTGSARLPRGLPAGLVRRTSQEGSIALPL